MEIIPAIDIRGGRCVRLEQGDFSRETVFSDDPVEMALRWTNAGATRLHVVDLDGARSGKSANDSVISAIARASSVPIQVGGGIRDEKVATRYIEDLGVDRIVIGTSAVRKPQVVRHVCDRWPERVVVAVDARDGVVAIEGWTEASDLTIEDLLETLVGLGLLRILYTDINRDGTLSEPNFDGIKALIGRFPLQVIASGGVATIRHLHLLQEIGAEAAIVGRALYTGAIDLDDAIRTING